MNSDRLWNKNFILVTISSFFLFIPLTMLLSTIPLYGKFIGGTDIVAGLIISIFTFTAVFTRFWFGYLLDNCGRKVILITGLLIFTVATFAYNWANLVAVLLFLRFVHGIGWGAANTALATVASDVIPPTRRAEGFSYNSLANSFAMAFGPALGLFIVNNYTYELLFLFSGISSALGVISSVFINYQVIFNPKRESMVNSPKVTIIERTAIAPSLIMLCFALTYGGIIGFLPAYANFRGIQNIGLFYTVYAFVLIVNRPLAGKLADRYGSSQILIPSMIILIIAMVLLNFAANMPLFILAAMLYGLSFGNSMPLLNAITIALAPAENRGAATASLFSAMDMGIGVGAFILGLVSQKFGIKYLYSGSIVFSAVCLIMYFIVLHPKLKHHKISREQITVLD